MNDLKSSHRIVSSFNRKLAWKHFYPEGNGKAKKGYVLHHIDSSLRHNNIERYIQWNIEDLMMITRSEHSKIHAVEGEYINRCHTPEATEKMSQKLLGNTNAQGPHNISDEGRVNMGHWRGRKFPDEIRLKLGRKGEDNPSYGKHWWIDCNGNKKYQTECPGEGWVRGYKQKPLTPEQKQLISIRQKGCSWWNNGINQTHCKECPGEGWIKGRLKHK